MIDAVSEPPMLRIEQLTKRFGSRMVLRSLSLSIAPGQIYGLLGPNGAGKTTTINILCHLLTPDSGIVRIADQPISDITKRWLGVAPQETLVYKTLTCAENLRFFGRIYGLKGETLRQRVADGLQSVGLSDRAQSVAETLSGGMQRRLSMAIALIHQPKLLILDEPTTGLDIETRYDIWELIRQLRRQGMTILLTTHLLDEAERLCDRIGILKQGNIWVEGSLDELRRTIPAAEILLLHTADEAGAIARGQALEYPHRYYGAELAFWLPQALELKEILQQFDGIPIDSVTRKPVGLEHIYLDVTQRDRPERPTVDD